jgi:hypothetical protein
MAARIPANGKGGSQPVEVGYPTPTGPPTPFGACVEAVQTGDLLFLSGMLPVENQKPKFVGRIGKD